ncbi:MAG TPA: S-methyl-5'-thioadenosine phosphorylase [Elusimicrobia bacterium]|nr:MAG: methylthioadenosine phosphorylase [Elusimicrobia bacterium GWA2_66_18]OGR69002.1 MAG: methylthioadenosine phosphorylase [Elusimicrobia bacterium GWC2_65_9]HAZ07042.1 S-methyl-5'-thioadenosine phosphorylase [Elusimicrobiota bacterium]
MKKTKKPFAKVGVIGGSGLYRSDSIKDPRELRLKTPFGAHSGPITLGELEGVPCAFLPRHGRGHVYTPTELPQRANMWALKSLGVERVLAFSAVGSLKEELPPRTFVFPDQLVDRTKNRVQTFFGGGVVAHVALNPPFAPEQNKIVYECARELGIPSAFGGTYCCMEGPAFSTKAESEMHRACGFSLIGMTAATEAKLAREAELVYSQAAMVTDYDCWKEGTEVHIEMIVQNLHANSANAQRLMRLAVPRIARAPLEPAFSAALAGTLFTDPQHRNRATLKKLDLLVGKYL